MSIGSHIKKLRLEKGLSLSELSIQTGIAKSYLSSIERDLKSNPSLQVLEKISDIFHVDIQTLVNEEKATENVSIDPEWLELIQEATELHISKEEFKQYMEFAKWKQDNKKI